MPKPREKHWRLDRRTLATQRAGAIAYLVSVEYFAGELVAAAAWSTPPYSWTANYISDLGLTMCSQTLCSPRHAVMNGGLFVLGMVVILGSLLLRDRLFVGRLGRSALLLMLLSGVGDVMLALFPGTVETDANGADLMHVMGAVFAIVGGNTGILLCGVALALAHRDRVLAGYSLISGATGLVALALFANEIDLGLGIGGIERVAANPVVIWMVVAGAYTLTQLRSAADEP